MKIKYLIVDGKPHLVVAETDYWGFTEVTRKIWNFIHSHQRFPLRPYYFECKAADARPYYVEHDVDFHKGETVLVLSSSWEKHKPYVEILQKELNLRIENLPE